MPRWPACKAGLVASNRIRIEAAEIGFATFKVSCRVAK